MPRRVAAILTGESLVNDATALTLFSLAIAALNGARTGVAAGVGRFLFTALVGIGIGSGHLQNLVFTAALRKRLRIG